MDKLYFLEDILQPDRMDFGEETSVFDHDAEGVGRSLLLELMGKNTVQSSEKRAHERFQAQKDAFALIRPAAAAQLRIADRSMAQIACAVYRSKPVRFGRIVNLSMGGILFHYINVEERFNASLVLDILVADSGFYLENLAFKNISDIEIEDDFVINSFKMRLNRVQFEGLEPAVIMKLKYFIENYTVYKGHREISQFI
jgi:hypothetical protein